jgi:hypothetical protein
VQNSPVVIHVYFVDLEASVVDPNWAGWADMVPHGSTMLTTSIRPKS